MKPLTICIGIICEKRKKAIAIADRMITDDELSIQFEHTETKISKLSKNCIAMTSGSAFFFQEILDPITEKYNDKSPRISEIKEAIANSYSEIRKKKIEDLYFKPMNLTIERFNQEQSNLDERIIEGLGRVFQEFEFPGGLEILVIGVDDKAHVYLVNNPGIATPLDAVGWGSIGTGSPHAEYTFISGEYCTKFPFNKAVYLAYEAKRRAEVAPGVGKATDIYLIDNKDIHELSKEGKEKLKNIFDEKEKSIRPIEKDSMEKVSKLTLW